ncbi:hypothetical protein KP509_21G077400 [Ceratopteris richardii]|uniref:PPM-type phosphatase domain-containing protein n=2 Tax=Ceratopteris richardii TaxID=49495 RepID=A0A8T2SEK6_CERRI|nr:hypothetical protein KP509_21G077400 [Ceratopteris richardii]
MLSMEPASKRAKSESVAAREAGGDEDLEKARTTDRETSLCESVGAGCENAFHSPGSNRWVAVEAEAAEDKGCRHTMEDAWVILPDASDQPEKLRCSHFAIFDGHGGRHAAEFAQAHLHENVVSAGLPRELVNVKAAKKAIISGFKMTDEALLRESLSGGWQDGATAVCVWILGNTVFIANVGDAKAVLARAVNASDKGEEKSQNEEGVSETPAEGLPLKGVTVTREHKAIFPSERARIEKAGGFVGENGRLLGRLEVSRAFGDRQFKKVGVSAVPDVNSFEISERERFMILGCDGLWGVFGPSDAVDFVNSQLKEGVSVGVACRRLIREAIRERKCKDNCTAVLIVFKHAQVDKYDSN